MTPNPPPYTDPAAIKRICSSPTPAKVDVTIKFNELPQARFGPGVAAFAVAADGRVILIELKRKNWLKLETAVAEWPQWVATVQGQMGPEIDGGFQLLNPGLQVFEKKPKALKEEPKEVATPENPVPNAVESAPEVAPSDEPAPTYPKLSLKSKKSGA
jgi:hypothetical protein